MNAEKLITRQYYKYCALRNIDHCRGRIENAQYRYNKNYNGNMCYNRKLNEVNNTLEPFSEQVSIFPVGE
jgi:hypothetical protein